MTKEVARSLLDMAASDTMAAILNREVDVEGVVATMLDHWRYDLYARKPGPALLENGALEPTDLDLACFLSALVDRGAVIAIPEYARIRASTKREGQRVLPGPRRGQLIGLTANREVFSFSVKINDMSVVTAGRDGQLDKIGRHTNLALVGLDGKWHDGWKCIEFMPDAKENAFLDDHHLWTGHQVVFKNFVHPNRWTSFYGQYYFLTKALIQRLTEEAAFYRGEAKRLRGEGIVLPTDLPKEEHASAVEKGPEKSIQVAAFEAEIDAPFHGEFKVWHGAWTLREHGQRILEYVEARAKQLSYTVVPMLTFAVRATELAFFQAGMKDKGFPAWFKNADWQEHFVPAGKKTEWYRLGLTQLLPGQTGFALRYRTRTKTERVAADLG